MKSLEGVPAAEGQRLCQLISQWMWSGPKSNDENSGLVYFWNSFLLPDIRVQRFGWVNRWTINNDLCFHIYLGMLYLAVHVSSSGKLPSWCQYNIWQLIHSPWRKPWHSLNKVCKGLRCSDTLAKLLFFNKTYTKMHNGKERRLRHTSQADCRLLFQKHWQQLLEYFLRIRMNCNDPWMKAGLWNKYFPCITLPRGLKSKWSTSLCLHYLKLQDCRSHCLVQHDMHTASLISV